MSEENCYGKAIREGTAWGRRAFVRAIAGLEIITLTWYPLAGYANPVGGVVSGGNAAITQSGKKLDVNQTSDKAVIDWQSFNINTDETTAFHQPSASSTTLNRVHDNDPSKILGTLSANGRVILINPNGVFFGKDAKVDVSGLVASTANIKNGDFLSGNLAFSGAGNGSASIINQGTITARQAGLVGLVAPTVENDGLITAKLGKVTLASGDTFTLDMAGDNLTEIAVTGDLAKQIVNNQGKIEAAGGKVTLTAAAARGAVDSLVSNSGVIQANAFQQKDGEIILYAEGANAVPGNVTTDKGKKQGASTALNSGVLDVSGNDSGEKGGKVSVLADHVGILNGSFIDASGDRDGGAVHVGGQRHGEGATPTAERTIVQSNTVTKANATGSGDGGNVIVWADDHTDFAGRVEAKGGLNGGNGGFVETSGKKTLTASGVVDASAPKGEAGDWLLDPNNITISTGADTNDGGDPNFTSTNDNAVVNTTTVQNDLNAGTNVTITTGSAGANTQAGDITVSNAITKSAGGDATLTLSAYRNITLNAAISSSSNKLNLLLNADNAGNGSGYINVGAAITTNGGNVTMGGGAGAISAGSGYAVGNSGQADGIKVNNVAVDAGGGTIIMNGKGYNTTTNGNVGVEVTGAIGAIKTSGTGTVTISGIGQGNTNSGTDYGVTVNTGGVISSVDGALTINATGGGAGTGTGNHGVYLTGANSTIKTTGAGNISVTATGGNATGTGGNNVGVYVGTANGIQTTGTGTITVSGTAGNGAGSGASNYGVFVTGGSITGGGGNVSITGKGAIGSGDANAGILVSSGTIRNTGSGAVTISATGGGNTNSGNDYGLLVSNGGVISTVDGDLTITNATGGGAGTGANNDGIWITNANSTIKSTGAGSIFITATGGNATGSGVANYGIYAASVNAIQATGTGNITVNGSGSNGSGSGSGNYGVLVAANGIQAMGTGSITVTGVGGNATGGNNIGVYVFGGNSIAASGGAIAITGTGGNGGGANNYGTRIDSNISNTGAGIITITSIGKNGAADLYNGGGAVTIGGASATGNIILNQDSATWGALAIQTTGALTFAPNTVSTTIGVAGGAGTLRITSTVLNAITGASGITIGRSDGTGAITANAYTWSAPATLLTGTGGISLSGMQTMSAHTFVAETTGASDITIGAAGGVSSTAANTAITLVSGQNFINNAGAGGLSASSGRWVVYSTNPANDTIGGLSNNFRRFSCTYGGACPAFPGTGNGLLYSYTPTLTATPTALSITYGDAAPNLTGYTYTLSGYLGADASADTITGSLNGTTAYTQGSNAGTYAINYSNGSLAGTLGYNLSYANNNATGLTVNPRTLTASLTGITSKTYDGNTNAALGAGNYNLAGSLYGSDVVSLNNPAAGTFDTKNVGVGKTVSVSGLSLSGASAANYTLSSTSISGAIGTILAKPVTITGVTGNNKTYDGTTTDTPNTSAAALSGLVAGDNLTITSGAGAFADKNVGAGKAVTFSGFSVAGADSGNYTLTGQPAASTADITPAALTITANDKVRPVNSMNPTFDATYTGLVGTDTSANVTGLVLTSLADSSSPAGMYAITASGATAGNYTITLVDGILTVYPRSTPPVTPPHAPPPVTFPPTGPSSPLAANTPGFLIPGSVEKTMADPGILIIKPVYTGSASAPGPWNPGTRPLMSPEDPGRVFTSMQFLSPEDFSSIMPASGSDYENLTAIELLQPVSDLRDTRDYRDLITMDPRLVTALNSPVQGIPDRPAHKSDPDKARKPPKAREECRPTRTNRHPCRADF